MDLQNEKLYVEEYLNCIEQNANPNNDAELTLSNNLNLRCTVHWSTHLWRTFNRPRPHIYSITWSLPQQTVYMSFVLFVTYKFLAALNMSHILTVDNNPSFLPKYWLHGIPFTYFIEMFVLPESLRCWRISCSCFK